MGGEELTIGGKRFHRWAMRSCLPGEAHRAGNITMSAGESNFAIPQNLIDMQVVRLPCLGFANGTVCSLM